MIYSENNEQTVALSGDILMVNHQLYNLPERIKKRAGHSITQINGKLYIDCYKFEHGKFKLSLIALWHMIF